MKQLLIGIAIVVVVGTAGFVYRYEMENPKSVASGVATGTPGTACSADAKVCPDGSAVGRTGPNCTFAVCAPPNVQLTTGSTTIGFVLPSGYQRNIVTSDESSYIASYVQSTSAATDASSSVIDMYAYPIPAGETPGQVMLSNTYFNSSNLQATSTSSFQNVTEGSNIFSEAQIGSFDGVIQTSYYLTEPNLVLRFDITEKGVQDSTDPSLDINSLPQHQALEQMLATLQVGST